MTQLNTVDAARSEGAGYKVDVSRGQRIGRVSSEWFSRPADERYLSLSELFGAVNGRAERSRTRTVESAAIRVEANRDDAERLTLLLPGEEVPLAPTHWSFGQLTTMIGAPSTYLRQLPAPLGTPPVFCSAMRTSKPFGGLPELSRVCIVYGSALM